MSTHIAIILALSLFASGARALPPDPAPATYATEAELLSAPGSAGYLVDGEFTAGADVAVPLCDCEEEEGDGEDGAEPPPEEGGDDGGPETDEGETGDEGGC
jgi:hypothetical protein